MKAKDTGLIMQPLLFTPGPTQVPEYIRQAMAQPTLHHRTSEFETIFMNVRTKMRDMLNMIEVLFLASSGTGAMEACISAFSTKKILSINSGKFGERFGAIGRALRREVIEIKNEWDTPVSKEEIEKVLTQHDDIECICLQICESAGGLLHPYKEIAQYIKEKNENIFVIIDAITAMGVEKIDTTHIDALIGGSQKAFMLPPGLSIIGLNQNAISHIENHATGYYFNLAKELKNQRKNTTAYTPAISIIIGLNAYFTLLEENNLSIEDIYTYSSKIAHASRDALKAIGLKIYPKMPANSMSVIISEHAKEIIHILKKRYKITLASGQDGLKNKIFRINHMGYIPLHEISFTINAIELALDEIGIRQFNSDANKIFFTTLHS